MGQEGVKNPMSSEHNKKYHDVISYLLHSYNSGSDFFILRPGNQLKVLNLDEENLINNGQYIVDYLLESEKNGAEIYVRKPNDTLKRVLLREWFINPKLSHRSSQGRIANLVKVRKSIKKRYVE